MKRIHATQNNTGIFFFKVCVFIQGRPRIHSKLIVPPHNRTLLFNFKHVFLCIPESVCQNTICMAKALCCRLGLKVEPARNQNSAVAVATMKGHFGRSPGLNELSGTLSRDTGHQQMRTPSCRRFLHTLSVFLSVHFFQDKHFAKSLFLDSKISDPFFLSLVSKRPNNSSTKVIFHFFCSLLREGACHLPIVNNMVISV